MAPRKGKTPKPACALCGSTRGSLRPIGPAGPALPYLACHACKPDAAYRPLAHAAPVRFTDGCIARCTHGSVVMHAAIGSPHGVALAPSTLADGTSADPLSATHSRPASGEVMADALPYAETSVLASIDAATARIAAQNRLTHARERHAALSDAQRLTTAHALAVFHSERRRNTWGMRPSMLRDVDTYAADALCDWYSARVTGELPQSIGRYVLDSLDAARMAGGTGIRHGAEPDLLSIEGPELAELAGPVTLGTLVRIDTAMAADDRAMIDVPGRWLAGRFLEPERVHYSQVCTADLEASPEVRAAYAVILSAMRAERTAETPAPVRKSRAGRKPIEGREALIGRILATVASEAERAAAWVAATGRSPGSWRVAKLRYVKAGGRPVALETPRGTVARSLVPARASVQPAGLVEPFALSPALEAWDIEVELRERYAFVESVYGPAGMPDYGELTSSMIR